MGKRKKKVEVSKEVYTQKLFDILNKMRSCLLASKLLSNFERHFGELEESKRKEAVAIIRSIEDKSDFNWGITFGDFAKFNTGWLLHDDKKFFIEGLNDPFNPNCKEIEVCDNGVVLPGEEELNRIYND